MKRLIIIFVSSLFLLTGCSWEESLEVIGDLLDDILNEYIEQKELEATSIHKELSLYEMEVHYIDVGQGDATLLRFYDEDEAVHILYDTGDWKGNEVVPYLQQLEITDLDLVIISHPHADHIGQLKGVLENFNVHELWMTGNQAETDLFQTTMQTVLNQNIHYLEPTAGDKLTIGPLLIEVLHPGETLTGDLNRDSLAARFTYGDISFMFTGDAYIQSEEEILNRFKNVEANFLQLGHHGSNTSNSKAFIQAVNPDYAIYSAGFDNKYGHPHTEIRDLFTSLQIPLYGTDEHGTIVVTTDGTDAIIDTYPTRFTSDCININEATEKDLQKITHINASRAAEIIALRPYDSIYQLDQIDGIGKGRLKAIHAENKACAQ